MEIKVSEIVAWEYRNTLELSTGDKVAIPCEPTKQDIETALKEEKFETRGFQAHKDELIAEWYATGLDVDRHSELARTYHARRIAYFIKNGWPEPDPEPITVERSSMQIKDGLHRLKAVRFKNEEMIDVRFV